MAAVNKLRLYDINANKPHELGAYTSSSDCNYSNNNYNNINNNNNNNNSTQRYSNSHTDPNNYYRPSSMASLPSPTIIAPLTLQTPPSTLTSPRSPLSLTSPRSPSTLTSPRSPSSLSSPRSPTPRSPLPSPLGPPVAVETREDIEYTRAPDMFPCGHVLCHNCVRKFMRLRQRSGYSRCPVCHRRVDDDAPLQAMGIPTPRGGSTGSRSDSTSSSTSSSFFDESGPASPTSSFSHSHAQHEPEESDPTPVSLLNNFDEIVKKFNGIQYSLRRLKNESVQSKSMGMTFTNTQCHLCMENHGTLRVVQEYNNLAVRHERPHQWSNYFYRLQHGKVVTEFHSQVNSSCICVPCTYKELRLQNLPDLPPLPDVNPQQNTQICLAEHDRFVISGWGTLFLKSRCQMYYKISDDYFVWVLPADARRPYIKASAVLLCHLNRQRN
ncbi:peptidyl-prolyl cis-trans isomerase-like 6 [Plakobranchus ocellatus]|uniref:Peptidyl-prolyl cis-trans isomerase-like 6 n=1 Tax=Plakobranchus ocellatus TaxID=259542 RepID=A0AAV4AN86_9GAST|nr:peptidyl-prolyl cis-trans isomerase-like 6 [Plakobranchus ocellatus]